MAASAEVNKREEQKKQVMIGNLPNDFLRITPTDRQQQLAADEQAAVALQQQLGGGFSPPNASGRLTISVIEARLNKNYGVTRMDPYVRLRSGHVVYETPTDYNGAKNPKWNKVFHCLLPYTFKTVAIGIEIFDECAFTLDEKIAWAQFNIPEAVFQGEPVEKWIPLSGKLGEEKEGTIYMVFAYSLYPVASQMVQPMMVLQSAPCYGMTPGATIMPGVMPYYGPGVAMYPPAQYPTGQQPWVAPNQLQQPRQPTPQRQIPVVISDEDIKQVREVFPSMDYEVVKTVLESHRGNKDMAINALLQMSSEN